MSKQSLVRPFRALLALLLLAAAGPAKALVCDVNGDGVIDRTDIGLITAARNTPASGPDDLRNPDGDGLITIVDARTCTLRCTRAKCSTENIAPIANAGPDQTVALGSTVALDGRASADPDGGTLTYTWRLLARPAGSAAVVTDASSATPGFVADAAGTYVAELVVSDGRLASVADTVTVSTENSRPVAVAGPGQTVKVGATVTLSGAGSTDVDGDPLTFAWRMVSRPSTSAAALVNPTSPDPSFVADRAGSYSIELVVSDGRAASAPSTVIATTSNTPPVADAGPDQSVLVGERITLDGSRSSDVDGNALTFIWALVTKPAGSAAVLSDPFAVNPAFIADKAGLYVAQLVVNDGTVLSSPDTVSVSTRNSPPVAAAGPGQTVAVGSTVALDGSGSTDPDGDSLAFRWALIAKPPASGAVLSDALSVNPSFVADAAGTYVAQLIVNDGSVDGAPATVTVTTGNTAPVADAGPAQFVALGATVTLDGSRSTDVDGDALTYAWSLTSKPAGSAAVLSNAAAVGPTFVADRPGSYVAQLVVRDGSLASAPATVVVSTVNTSPVANAGPDQTVPLGATVTLDGTASADADGNPLTYAWAITARPAGSAATLSLPGSATPSFVVDRAGTYAVQLTVRDGVVDSGPDSVVITTLNSVPVANAGPDQAAAVGGSVTLDGSGSADADGDSLGFTWAILSRPSGSVAALSDPAAVAPSLAIDRAGSYVVQLIVSDGRAGSVPDTVVVSTLNSAPRANAGPDQSLPVGSTARLDGSGSSDPDGDPLTYVWSMTSRPAGSSAALDDPALPAPSFLIDRPGSYIVQLVVGDGRVTSGPDTVVVSTVNRAPVADAGPDQTVTTGTLVTLDGSGSGDADGDALGYAWTLVTKPAGSAAQLVDPAAVAPRLPVDAAGSYVIQLVVNDGRTASAPDSVTVNALRPNAAPVAGQDAYSVVQGTVLAVGAPGVLGNDSDPDGDAISATLVTTAGNGSLVLEANGSFSYTPNAGFTGTDSFTYVARDGLLGSNTAAVTIGVTPANRAPVIGSVPPTSGTAGQPFAYQVVATDPDGDLVSFTLVSGPAGMTIDAAGLLSWTPPGTGAFPVALEASDPAGARTGQSFVITVGAPNALPRITSVPNPTAATGGPYSYQVIADDPEGDPLSYALATAPAGMAIGGAGLVSWAVPVAGTHPVTVRVGDGHGFAVQSYTLTVLPGTDALPLDLSVTPSPPVIDPGQNTTITVTPSGGTGAVSLTLLVDGLQVPLGAGGQAVISGAQAGVHPVEARATDAGGTVVATSFFSVRIPADTAAPVAQISSPVRDSEIAAPVTIVGTASDANLAEYQLLVAPAGSTQRTEIARGTTSVVNGPLGVFDPTQLANGIYDVVLRAVDVNGRETLVRNTYEVLGDLKVGNFSITFEDLSVETSGIPIRVARTYDTRRRNESLDFGFGWTVDYQNVTVQSNGLMGANWQTTSTGFIIKTFCIDPVGRRTVGVTLPDGRLERFDFSVSPRCQQVLPPRVVTPVFTPRPGTRSTLTTPDPGLLVSGGDTVLDSGTAEPFDPTTFTLTTEDGFVYQLDKGFGIRSVRDPAGNTLTYSSNGITHSAGKSVAFTRDGSGRIVSVTDPNGRALRYAYNARGDLATVTDRDGAVSRMTYNRTHGLLHYTDPRGVMLARSVYDEDGRLVEQYDAEGNPTTIGYDTASRQTVRDPRGGVTVYEYDGAGNVSAVTDALGGITRYTYDARGNELTTTDPAGNVTIRTYDARDRVLSERDALGNASSFAYATEGQVTTVTDPRGGVTTFSYGVQGAATQVRNALGLATNMAYDTRANLTAITDALGNATAYAYDAAGRRIAETDALGRRTDFTYDANGNEVSRTRQRTLQSGAIVTMSASKTLDANGRVLLETDFGGGSTVLTYNPLGKVESRRDPAGNLTTYQYDGRGKLARVAFPDGTSETYGHDASGNEISRTDRAGRTTLFAYDALGRLIRTTYPDGSFVEAVYDAAGRMVRSRDERGVTTATTYDAAGRRTGVTDALGNVTTFAYDAAGNLIRITDPRGGSTGFEYDAINRLVRTTFPDASSVSASYDAADRKIQETDAAGRITRFGYDAVGRLVQVTDPLGGVTSYGYDEVGNRVSQTDALGRVTRWQYDNVGRVVSRTLPGGQSETFGHDANGNQTTHTDFNGAVSTQSFDADNRPVSRVFPDGRTVSFGYTPTGRLASVTDARGVIRYAYDSRDRLVRVENPDGSVLGYAYDAAGNRTQLAVQQGAQAPRVTRNGYDAANRLVSVADPEGLVTAYAYDAAGNRASVTYPNGTRTDHVYDALNRLTGMDHRRGAQILGSYRYTLAPNGERTRLVETQDGRSRTVDYIYDALGRLVREAISDPATGNRAIDYTYDAVGNRLTRSIDGALTTYVYDGNDRLLSESGAAGATTHAYDANGNLIRRVSGAGTVTLAYDFDNRLVETRDGTSILAFAYDAWGNRVSSSVNGVPTRYVVDAQSELAQVVEERDAAGGLQAAYVRGGGDLVKQLRGGRASFYLADGTGSTRLLTDAAGAVTDSYVYEAFGGIIARTGTTPNLYLYTGEQFDPNLGFYYLRARYLDPAAGRFITMDTWMGRSRDPRSLHKYAYVHGDPVNYRDPTGHMAMSLGGFGAASSGFATLSSIATVTLRFAIPLARPVAIGLGVATVAVGVFDYISYKLGFPVVQNRVRPQLADYLSLARARAQAVPRDADLKYHGHHPIPVYLCGALEGQGLVPVESRTHSLLHSAMYGFSVFVDGVGDVAFRGLHPIFSRTAAYRGFIRTMAASGPLGRGFIAESIDLFYDVGWYGIVPGLFEGFLAERSPFVSGVKTSLPDCARP